MGHSLLVLQWGWVYDREKSVATRVASEPVSKEIDRALVPRLHDASYEANIVTNSVAHFAEFDRVLGGDAQSFKT